MHKRGEGDGVSRIWHGGSSMSGCWSIPSRASQHRPEMAEKNMPFSLPPHATYCFCCCCIVRSHRVPTYISAAASARALPPAPRHGTRPT